MDKKIFNMATFPAREKALKDCIDSIINQADEIHVYLNEYDHVPDFLNHEKITAYMGTTYNHPVYGPCGDLGDVGKFIDTPNQKGYIFTVDDKLVYPADYAEKMIETVEQYKRKAVVSCHGRIFPNRAVRSYYGDILEYFGCTRNVLQDRFAHELGTGVMCFHSDTLTIDLTMFGFTNGTDIQLSAALQKMEIPILIRRHFMNWIQISKNYDPAISISTQFSQSANDKFKADYINKQTWEVRTC